MLPAFWYLFAGVTVFGFVDGFTHLSLQNLAVLAGLFLLSILVDSGSGLLGAKLGGAGWKSLLFGMLGGLLGFLIMPPVGIFAGLFIGILIGELLRNRSQDQALRAASGALLGAVAGVLINGILAIIFVASFILFALF
ncbi:MAG: DUF456 domain-containing protein [bacterium]|nr:DUF456 domain-containing protein [bacterium]